MSQSPRWNTEHLSLHLSSKEFFISCRAASSGWLMDFFFFDNWWTALVSFIIKQKLKSFCGSSFSNLWNRNRHFLLLFYYTHTMKKKEENDRFRSSICGMLMIFIHVTTLLRSYLTYTYRHLWDLKKNFQDHNRFLPLKHIWICSCLILTQWNSRGSDVNASVQAVRPEQKKTLIVAIKGED